MKVTVSDVVFDNEAVQALIDPFHPKHRVVLAHLAGIVARRKRGHPSRAVVPTAVRVEAGWDRTEDAAAAINRFRIIDHPLDSRTANHATAIRKHTGVSVADAHLGAAVRELAPGTTRSIVVLTSDPDDISRATEPTPVTIIRI